MPLRELLAVRPEHEPVVDRPRAARRRALSRSPAEPARFGRWSEPRMTCVIPRSRSSTTEASWYVAVPSGRRSVVPPRVSRTAPSSSRSALPVASARSAASACRELRSLWRSGPSSIRTPSQARSAAIASSPPSTLRAGSVSSIRRISDTAARVREAPVRDSRQRVSDVQRPRRARREADANRHALRVDRDVAGLRRDALEPRADRRIRARARTRPRAPRACTRTARCPRASSARRRRTSGRPARAPSRRAPCSRPRADAPSGARSVQARPSTSSRTARPRCAARGCTARRTATAAPGRARTGSSGTYCVPSPKYQRIAFDSASGRPSSSTSVGTRSAGFSSPSTSERFERSTTDSSSSRTRSRAAPAGGAPCNSCPRPRSCRGASWKRYRP